MGNDVIETRDRYGTATEAEAPLAKVTGTAHGDKFGLDTDILGASKLLRVTPVITLTAYVAKDSVGGVMTLTNAMRINAGTGVLESLIITDRIKQNAEFEVHFFSTTFTATDAGIFAPTDTQVEDTFLGTVIVSTYISNSVNSTATVKNIGLLLNSASASKDIFATLVCTGTPDYTNASDLTVVFGILQD